MKWFAPWLDPQFANKAAPGELRYAIYVTAAGRSDMVWVDGPGEYDIDGELYTAKSYTFIPASLKDNPFRNTPEYRAQLQSLPEPLRSQLLYGDFNIGSKDDESQVIKTAWVRAAQQRWTRQPPEGVPMCAIAVDASGGGDDPMVISRRYDSWFDELVVVPGEKIPEDRIGTHCAGIVFSYRRDDATIVIDMGGGYGGGIFEHCKANAADNTFGHKGAAASLNRTVDRQMSFYNKRSEVIWRFREALDPDQPGGSPIALPPDPQLTADLTAPTWEPVSKAGGMAVKVESKEDVCARLGRSTDKGDAVVMAWSSGTKQAHLRGGWGEQGKARRRVVVNMGPRKMSTNGNGAYAGQARSREHG